MQERMTSSEPSSPRKRTPGEELWTVHLRRANSPHHDHADDEDDHDYEVPSHPPKLTCSVGEELFLTHLKRSQGLEPDYDVDEANQEEQEEPKSPTTRSRGKQAANPSKSPSPKKSKTKK